MADVNDMINEPTSRVSNAAPRVALVTGAGSGIGRATAHRLANLGYAVVCVGRRIEPLQETAADLADSLAIVCDVGSEADVKACMSQVMAHYSRLDVLVNNAGIGSTARAEDETAEHFDAVMAVNARGAFLFSKYAVPYLRESRGCIINVASARALVGATNRVAYCTAKTAMLGLTRAMAVDHVGEGIRVNAICPGGVHTPWVDQAIARAPDPAAVLERIKNATPIGRMGTSEEIAAAIAYLASDDAAFITGIALAVDGGLTMQ